MILVIFDVCFPERVTAAIVTGMKRMLFALATVGFGAIWSGGCLAEDRAQDDPAQMSREQWRSQVNSSRQRAEEMRRQRRGFVPQAPSAEEIAEEASRRAFKDDSLRPGDVISTNRGFFRYQGFPDQERKPDDFVRIR